MCGIDWAMLLEYLKVLLGWPVVTAAILIVLMYRFSDVIGGKLSGLREVGYPGGAAKFDPARSQGATGGESLGTLELPASTAPVTPGPNVPNKALSQRTQQLLADAGAAAPQLTAAVDYAVSNPGPTVDMYIEALFRHHCERAYGAIFGGQLLALEYINAKGLEASVPEAELAGFIRVHAEKATAAGQTPLTPSQFVGFLLRSYLIRDIGQPGNGIYRVTYTGQQFLAYIKETYPLGWNSRAL